MGIRWVCITAGSPYYNPHMQRPALFPPSDGYLPPEDPLVGVARQIAATASLKKDFPSLAIVGSAYSYLQEWLPHVAQYAVRHGMTDFVGLGRMVLSYPELPADVLAGRPLQRKQICRTFSDCTTGPRLGLVSGCFPLDPFYVKHPDAEKLKELKGRPNASGGSADGYMVREGEPKEENDERDQKSYVERRESPWRRRRNPSHRRGHDQEQEQGHGGRHEQRAKAGRRQRRTYRPNAVKRTTTATYQPPRRMAPVVVSSMTAGNAMPSTSDRPIAVPAFSIHCFHDAIGRS